MRLQMTAVTRQQSRWSVKQASNQAVVRWPGGTCGKCVRVAERVGMLLRTLTQTCDAIEPSLNQE